MLTRVTDTIIEELITSACGAQADPRCRHWLTHALHGLVRVARVEQLQELRHDVERARGDGTQRVDQVSVAAGCGSATTRRT